MAKKKKSRKVKKVSKADKERISKLRSLIWLGWIPRIIGLVFGILWLLFGVLEGLATPEQWYIGVVEGLIVGGTILITTWILFKKQLAGATIFAAEAVFVFSLLMFRRVSYVAIYLALGTPLLITAILAFVHYFVVKELLRKK